MTVPHFEGPHHPPYAATIPAMLRHLAATFGAREAQVSASARLTFGELERRSAEMARGLLALGIGKGSTIAVLIPNGPEFTLIFMAAARIGAIVAPLSTLYQAPELAWVLKAADIQILITCERYLNHNYLDRLETAFPALPGQSPNQLGLVDAPYLRSILVWGEPDRPWATSLEETLARFAGERPEIDEAFLEAVEATVAPADSLCMIHTSGSTAHPKGVVHGHGPMVRHSFQMAHDFWGASDGDRIVAVRPFFWIAGLSATLFHSLHLGACLITPPDPSAATFRRMIDEEGATALCGAEPWFRVLSDDPRLKDDGYEIHRLTADFGAVAQRRAGLGRYLNPVRAAAATPAEEPPQDFVARSFGMTETLGTHSSLPFGESQPADRPRLNGRAVPGVLLRVVDPQTGDDLGPGEVGELMVGGYSLMQGLYKKERSETFTADGLYPTGDLCSIDQDGYVRFVSRIGDMLKISGANVAPLEVETCLAEIPDLERSAVVGINLDARDTLLVAAVQMQPGRAFDAIAATRLLRAKLSAFKVPKRFFVLTEETFPVTGSGKVQKAELIKLLTDQLTNEGGVSNSKP